MEQEPKLTHPKHIFPSFTPFDYESFEYEEQQLLPFSDETEQLNVKVSDTFVPGYIPVSVASTPLSDNNPSQETSTAVAHSTLTPDVHNVDSPQPTTSKAIDERFITFRRRRNIKHIQAQAHEKEKERSTGTTSSSSPSFSHTVKKASKGKELICHPSEFKEVDDMENDSLTRIKRKANSFKRKSNPYSQSAFIYDFSDDSDFE